MSSELPCPVCDTPQFEYYNSDEICGVCSWHDDGYEDRPDEISGANHISLTKARANYSIYTVSKLHWIPIIRECISQSLTKIQGLGGNLSYSWLSSYLESPHERGRLLNKYYPYDDKQKIEYLTNKMFNVDEVILLYYLAYDMRKYLNNLNQDALYDQDNAIWLALRGQALIVRDLLQMNQHKYEVPFF